MLLTTDPQDAARALAAGHLAALPTETVYGLGARADDPHAVARVYATKGRPADHPLIVHVLDAEAAWEWGTDIPEYARALGQAHWPGPLTLVLPRSPRARDFITGGQGTVAVRVPVHPVMRATLEALIDLTDDPAIGVAAPSANRFGRVSPTTAQHVIDELETHLTDDDVVLEGGASEVGVESTIVDCTGDLPAILRPGAITADDVRAATGLALGEHSQVRAPGTLASHYAPTATVQVIDEAHAANPTELIDASQDARVGLLALAHVPTPPGMVRLSAPRTTEEYAQVLYRALREADALELQQVIAVTPPAEGVGTAVIDRLNRAATR